MHQQAERVVIGMDPHKRSATIEVMDAEEAVLGGGQDTDEGGFADMTDYVNQVQPDLQEAGCGRSRAATGSVIMSR